MKKLTLFLLATFLTLVMSGCGQGPFPTATPVPPTPTSVPPTRTPVPPTPIPINTPFPPTATAAAPEPGASWDYVALGDSVAIGFGGARPYVDYYAAYIEADLGVKVTLHNWSRGGQTSVELLHALRNVQELRSAISEAEVVTFVIGGNDVRGMAYPYQAGSCGGVDNLDCVRETLTSFRANYDAIIAEILTLRSTTDTIIRTMDYYFPFVNEYKELGVYEDLKKPYIEAFSEHIVQAASEHNIPVARVYLAFNGPNGDEDPADKGYLWVDGEHPSDAGHRLIAELHRELGYEPLAP